MASTHTLTGNIYDLTGATFGAQAVRVTVVTNLPAKEALVDKTTNAVHLGGKAADLDPSTGVFTVELIDTSATDLNVTAGTLQYEVRAEYVNPATRGRTSWASGWFSLTADANIADLATDASPLAVESASGYAQDAAESAALARSISEIDTTDAAMKATFELPGSQSGEYLSATYAGRNVARTIERLRAGQALTVTVLGDSTAATGTPGNAAGAPVEKAATLIDAAFPGSLTVTNRAVSGSTLLSAHLDAKVTAALADAADLYVFMFGRNDTLADVTGDRTPGGYAKEASLAALERDFASIRSTVDKADILVIGQGPSKATAVNDELLAWQADARALCAVWGVEFVDGYSAFSAVSGWETSLMYDTDHQNAAGNDLYAQTIADHFPASFAGSSSPASLPATKGLRNVAKIDRAVGNQGYVAKATPGTASGVTYTTGGTGWGSEVTSTVGDYVEASATNCTELFIDVDTTVATAAVVDVAIDGVTVATDVTLSATGKPSAAVWLPATGLTPGAHSFRLTLKSGTLRTYTVAALMSAASSFTPGTQTQSLTPGSFSTVTLTGTYADVIAGTSIPLPTGWASMDVVLTGWVQMRNTSATTKRTANVAIRDTGADVAGTMVVDIPASSFVPVPLAGHIIGATTARAVSVRARTTGTDLDLTTATAVHLVAQLIRKT